MCLTVSTAYCIWVAEENKITQLGQQDSVKCLLFTFPDDSKASASLWFDEEIMLAYLHLVLACNTR